jgi:hypothetical protein
MYEEQRIEPLTIYRDIRTGCGRENWNNNVFRLTMIRGQSPNQDDSQILCRPSDCVTGEERYPGYEYDQMFLLCDLSSAETSKLRVSRSGALTIYVLLR